MTVFSPVKKLILISVLALTACAVKPDPVARPLVPDLPEEDIRQNPFDHGLMNSYDVYLFLKNTPKEEAVVTTLGLPDSVWVDDAGRLKIYYYFLPDIRDYNSIEIDPQTGKVIGFEWD